MAIRVPKHPDREAVDIRYKVNGTVLGVTRIMQIVDGEGYLVWELVSSSFLDASGNVFYDASGVPFQGRVANEE